MWAKTAVALGLVLLALLHFSSCANFTGTVDMPPVIEGADFVGNAACYDCHTNYVWNFPASPHGKYYKDDPRWARLSGCESCHGPGSKHVELGGGRGQFILNPGKNPELCFRCHLQTQAEFHLPQHHPVMESHMNCVDCHDPHGMDIMKPAGGLAMARQNQSCAECHRDQARPFIFEHEALREGCIVCHEPHGSSNAKMLTSRDSNLCLKCHAQVQAMDGSGRFRIGNVPHNAFLSQGTCWSAGCHTAVHGSNVSPRMFY